MKVTTLITVATTCLATTAFGADLAYKAPRLAAVEPPSPWDIAFGGSIVSDYLFRGLTQSAHDPSASVFFSPMYNVNQNLQFYVGFSTESVKLRNSPAAEVDVWGGIRASFGPVAFDVGGWSYNYPGKEDFYVADWAAPYPGIVAAGGVPGNFVEAYGKFTWTVAPWLAVGANVNYSPDFLATTAEGTYVAGLAKITAPATVLPSGIGAYLSGEFGHQYLGTTDGGADLPDWNTWNVGVGFTWKAFTLDLRYTDTDLSKADCFTLTGDPHATLLAGGTIESNWCGARFTAKLSAATTVFSLMK
ncbi:TorF family putative porin [Rhodoplanes sp. TEM]|uniref:TorF family putative porin n=1 Tax=Rhodoplanes tepidamans TaxID=200616 RepID=A0ABT5J6B8_RHOTP|nr:MULTISPECIES: TorF family putative porin [Rhodoplanes]MDC7785207.1 TorF family putative porin [Rhodoplanes tepidamans]MDC7986752.1 TorF family putative porin [Rhodoplanes sp. TEM]MDQ0353465.1 uncharacterized protein (TIGR02001 family) [Rhodoplanes tepidamans]